ncbi:MAG: class I SAM-dependent methyltransferase [Sandaracinaceae bacterium]|nr:class I SAM-dependent methyltransferase [Sandaracinaceae bacterium]
MSGHASSVSARGDRARHRAFLDGYYGWAEPLYDVTRKPYLLGRDRALARIAARPYVRLVEVGAGTGRNLARLRALRPDATYAAIEPSAPMRRRLAGRCPWAVVHDGFAEDVDYRALFALARPDVILFSYSLSMIQDPARALRHARASLAPGGEVFVVDFGDLHRVPRSMAQLFHRWLDAFHVRPVDRALLAGERARVEEGRWGYYRIARLPPAPQPRVS